MPSRASAISSTSTASLDHPHLYRLATERPLPRESLPAGLEDRAAAPLFRVLAGDEDRARATWAFAHGMVILEVYGRFPPTADLAEAWRRGVAAFSPEPEGPVGAARDEGLPAEATRLISR